jgi:hypothetical protein
MVARQAVDGRRAETLEKLLEAGSEELRAVGHDALTVPGDGVHLRRQQEPPLRRALLALPRRRTAPGVGS